ncbi:hypothetical protein FAY30_11610 [Bacillus sp. S3]|uniref:hypothetical protein n=1 Tax=Bacillus sp. S3 TaxID=486398 RepID=UPI00118CC397|nr:hypothetical protein [Bacillus sp. S3]QCJ42506.1 hypothetical protein FAY30_11610 [Bacillus sp. S3]
MNNSKNMNHKGKGFSDPKSKKILQLEKQVSLGLWVQVLGQIIELKGLSELFHLEGNTNTIGEQQILTGVWIRTIGQILEAVSVSKQLGETDLVKLLQEQQIAITGDFLVSIGSAYEVIGGIHVLEEESAKITQIIP